MRQSGFGFLDDCSILHDPEVVCPHADKRFFSAKVAEMSAIFWDFYDNRRNPTDAPRALRRDGRHRPA
jgi:hypothetical protein